MKNDQKIVLHILYGGLGGHGNVFFSLSKADRNMEFQNIALFYGIENVREEYITQCASLNIQYTAHLKRKGFDLGFYNSVFKSLRDSQPDIIILHSATLILPIFFYRLFNKNVLIIVRDTQAHHLKANADWLFLKWALRTSNYLVFLTTASYKGAREHIANKKLLDKKAVIIPNGLDTDLYRPTDKSLGKTVVIGMQSRLQTIKDHPTLLKSFAIVRQKLPDYNFRLRIAGDGPTLNTLKMAASELGVENDVEFCGMLGEYNLLKFMASLDIYIHATFGETMSNSIMQAMSCGLPTIVSDVWGVSNMIESGVSGLLYPSMDEVALSACIITVITDDVLRCKLAVGARNQAARQYSSDRLFEDYKKLFNNEKH